MAGGLSPMRERMALTEVFMVVNWVFVRVLALGCRGGCTWERHRRMDKIVGRKMRDLGLEKKC
jgi:hypothetical protein